MAELFLSTLYHAIRILHKSGHNSLQITIKYLQFPLHSYKFPLESKVILQNTFFTVVRLCESFKCIAWQRF